MTSVKIIYHRDLAARADAAKLETEKIEEMKNYMTAFVAAKLGQIDMVINPKDTRGILMRCLEPLLTKREEKIAKKHSNMPL